MASPDLGKNLADFRTRSGAFSPFIMIALAQRKMPRSKTNFDTVRKIGLTLPGVEESTAYGSPALKLHGKLLACVPAHRSAEPGSLAVRVDFDDRAQLLADAPEVYYVTDHYLDYNAVLVRLSRVTPDVLRELLSMAHKFVTAHAARRSPSRHRPKPV
jgi:hypothetical protein